MKFYNYIFSFLLSVPLAYAAPLEENTLPQIVKDLIQNEQKSCSGIEDLNNKPGVYKIGSSLRKISYINHPIEYIVHSSKDQSCSSSASLYESNGGFYLIIFAYYRNEWREIFNSLVFDYALASPEKQDSPTNITIYNKGDPGFTVNKIEYEWDIKNNCYVQKSIQENIYNQTIEK